MYGRAYQREAQVDATGTFTLEDLPANADLTLMLVDAATGKLLLRDAQPFRVAPGATTFGRPAWAHLLCFSRRLRLETGQALPDVIPRPGAMTWSRAMPTEACASAVGREAVPPRNSPR